MDKTPQGATLWSLKGGGSWQVSQYSQTHPVTPPKLGKERAAQKGRVWVDTGGSLPHPTFDIRRPRPSPRAGARARSEKRGRRKRASRAPPTLAANTQDPPDPFETILSSLASRFVRESPCLEALFAAAESRSFAADIKNLIAPAPPLGKHAARGPARPHSGRIVGQAHPWTWNELGGEARGASCPRSAPGSRDFEVPPQQPELCGRPQGLPAGRNRAQQPP